MTLRDFSYWARGHGFEAVLIALGAVLAAHAWHAAIRLYTRRLDSADSGQATRHRRVCLQVVDRAAVVVLGVIATMLVLSKLNLPLTTLVAPATLAGAAIGFGSQRLVADFLSGFLLIAERQFGFGDMVQISSRGQSTGASGAVEELTLRYTRLRTETGDVLFIPNGEVRQVLNRSIGWTRVDINVPVPAGTDIDVVVEGLRTSIDDLRDDGRWGSQLLDAPVVAGIERLDLDRVDMRVSARTSPHSAEAVAHELRRRAVLALASAVGSDV